MTENCLDSNATCKNFVVLRQYKPMHGNLCLVQLWSRDDFNKKPAVWKTVQRLTRGKIDVAGAGYVLIASYPVVDDMVTCVDCEFKLCGVMVLGQRTVGGVETLTVEHKTIQGAGVHSKMLSRAEELARQLGLHLTELDY